MTEQDDEPVSGHTPDQRRAIEEIDHNLQIIACAGSGKTRVVANRVVHILDSKAAEGIMPENIDDTPSGMLLHGIMSSIAEFYSRNLATEIRKGMSQKAKSGSHPGMAPLGYLNLRDFSGGRDIRTIGSIPNAPTSCAGHSRRSQPATTPSNNSGRNSLLVG